MFNPISFFSSLQLYPTRIVFHADVPKGDIYINNPNFSRYFFTDHP